MNYLITLTGQGDTNIVIVNKDEWDFINDAKPLPYKIKKELKEWYQDCLENVGGSTDNDRALFMTCVKKIYHNIKDAMEYIKENDIEIVDGFNGCIY